MNSWNDDKAEAPTFMEPSAKAQSIAIKSEWFAKYEQYFRLCPVGKSFMIDLSDVKESSLRPLVTKLNKDHNVKFKIVKHTNCYEVYRKG